MEKGFLVQPKLAHTQGDLPYTGVPVWVWMLTGLALFSAGVVLRRYGRTA